MLMLQSRRCNKSSGTLLHNVSIIQHWLNTSSSPTAHNHWQSPRLGHFRWLGQHRRPTRAQSWREQEGTRENGSQVSPACPHDVLHPLTPHPQPLWCAMSPPEPPAGEFACPQHLRTPLTRTHSPSPTPAAKPHLPLFWVPHHCSKHP